MFGLPTEDDGTRTDALLAQNIISITHFEPDFDALRAASTRIVIGAGAESAGEPEAFAAGCARSSTPEGISGPGLDGTGPTTPSQVGYRS